jgi:hypothetical protein
MELAALIAIAYVLTGIALVGYDHAAPPLYRKAYVVQQDIRVGVLTWFVWPYVAAFDAYQESMLGRSGTRFILGVVGLAAAMFLWVRCIFLLILYIIGWAPLGYLVALVGGAFLSPFFTAFTMPQHGGRPVDPRGQNHE